MKLKCTGNYRNDARELIYREGEVFDADDVLAAILLSDAPECFKEVKPQTKRVSKPPVDKAVKSAPKEK